MTPAEGTTGGTCPGRAVPTNDRPWAGPSFPAVRARVLPAPDWHHEHHCPAAQARIMMHEHEHNCPGPKGAPPSVQAPAEAMVAMSHSSPGPNRVLSNKLDIHWQAEILNHRRYTQVITERYCMTHSDTGHRNLTVKSPRDFSQLGLIPTFKFCRCHADQYML